MARRHVPYNTAAFLVWLVWSITPISWLYTLTTILTYLAYIPSPPDALRNNVLAQIIHWSLFAMAAPEVPFSLYHTWLIGNLQTLRAPPIYTRRFLKQVLYKSLESGMNLDSDGRLSPSPSAHSAGSRAHSRQATATSDEDSDTVLVSPVAPSSPDPSSGTFAPTPGGGIGDSISKALPSFPSLTAPSASTLRQRLTLQTTNSTDPRPSFIRNPLPPSDPRAIDFQKMQAKWFHNAPYDSLHLENAYEWFSWSLFGMDYAHVLAERQSWIDAGRPAHPEDEEWEKEAGIEGDKLGLVQWVVRLLEIRAGGRKVREGRNEGVKTVRLTLDPVRISGRPLAAYVVIRIMNVLVWSSVLKYGFRWEKDEEGVEFVIKMPEGWKAEDATDDEGKRPVLFLHGLGMGLAQYASLLHNLGSAPELKERPLLILCQPHVSMNIFHPNHLRPHTKQAAAQCLTRAINRHGFNKSGLTVLSHSNGTVVHGWLLKMIPDELKRSCFVDPVCFCLWEPDVCYNFLYRTPRTGMELLLQYFVATEAGIALNLSRYFDWADCLLLYDEIPNPQSRYETAYYLAGEDAILDSERVRRYLHGCGVEEVEDGGNMKIYRDAAHGEILIAGGQGVGDVMKWIEGKI